MEKFNKIWFVIFFFIIILLHNNDFANSNKYLTNNSYQLIHVNTGDSLWTISTKYVTDKDDIRHLILAIKEINQLDNNTQIYPGQILKIPVKPNNIDLAQHTN